MDDGDGLLGDRQLKQPVGRGPMV